MPYVYCTYHYWSDCKISLSLYFFQQYLLTFPRQLLFLFEWFPHKNLLIAVTVIFSIFLLFFCSQISYFFLSDNTPKLSEWILINIQFPKFVSINFSFRVSSSLDSICANPDFRKQFIIYLEVTLSQETIFVRIASSIVILRYVMKEFHIHL
jgi:hypothetical protein